MRHRGIFHYCLHPENLTESPDGFAMFEEMLGHLVRARDRGDVDVVTMTEMAARMERAREGEPAEIRNLAAGAFQNLTPARPVRPIAEIVSVGDSKGAVHVAQK
jgi:hypothetical protein